MSIRSRALRRIACVAVLGPASLSIPVAGASAAPCPNEQLRVENNSTALPDCRAYEKVSPDDKGGTKISYFPGYTQVSPDGETAGFIGYGVSSEAVAAPKIPQYLADRTSSGWQSRVISPPQPPPLPGGETIARQQWLLSEDLSQAITTAGRIPSEGSEATDLLYRRDNNLNAFTAEADSGLPNLVALVTVVSNASLSAAGFQTSAALAGAPTTEEGNFKAYELIGNTVRFVGILPDGEPAPGGSNIGNSEGSRLGEYSPGAVSSDGSRVFFTSQESRQLYVRVDGAATEWVSEPHLSVPNSEPGPVIFQGASEEGRYAFFTSQTELTDESVPGANLYRYEVGTGALVDLSSDTPAAGYVNGLVGTSSNGSYVYYASGGSIYLYHGGATRLVGSYDQEGEMSAAGRVWGTRSSDVSPDGLHLMFSSRDSLTGYPNAGHREFYVYGAESGALSCVSCNPSGAPATADATVHGAQPPGAIIETGRPYLPRTMSDDGSRAFFDTAEALAASDSNGKSDVYEYEAGSVHLVSSGKGEDPAYLADVTPSGNDAFFVTGNRLLPSDLDSVGDLYDARVGGGFAQPPLAAPTCTGEACQPEATSPSALGTPGSASFSSPEGLTATPLTQPKPASKVKPKSLTRAQQLANALKACLKKAKKHRAGCESQARKKYGKQLKSPQKARKSTRHAPVVHARKAR
jgi:hypothetical protein